MIQRKYDSQFSSAQSKCVESCGIDELYRQSNYNYGKYTEISQSQFTGTQSKSVESCGIDKL